MMWNSKKILYIFNNNILCHYSLFIHYILLTIKHLLKSFAIREIIDF